MWKTCFFQKKKKGKKLIGFQHVVFTTTIVYNQSR